MTDDLRRACLMKGTQGLKPATRRKNNNVYLV